MTQVQLPVIRRKVLGDLLVERLVALPGSPVVVVYRGEVSSRGRRPLVDGSTDPPMLAQPRGAVAPYVVVFDGTGAVELEAGLARCGEQLRWTPQVTVAAAFPEDCLQTVDRVHAWLYGWQPAVGAGVAAGLMVPPPGFDPGPPRPDRTVSPVRWFVPLQWQLDLTT